MAGKVTVFGGTGFLGRRVVQRLLSAIFRCGSHRGIQNARQRFSPTFSLVLIRSMPTSMMIAPLPLP